MTIETNSFDPARGSGTNADSKGREADDLTGPRQTTSGGADGNLEMSVVGNARGGGDDARPARPDYGPLRRRFGRRNLLL